MEQYKYLPPKYSYSLKDLAEFLGIFEITEESIKAKRGEISETSSNLSYVTSSAFKPKKSQLDVIREQNDKREEEEEENDDDDERITEGGRRGREIGEWAKAGSNRMVGGINKNMNDVTPKQGYIGK